MTILLTVMMLLPLSISAKATESSEINPNTNYMEFIVLSIRTRNFADAEYYNSLRNQKIIMLGLQNSYQLITWDDAFCLMCAIYQEEGAGPGVGDNELLAQGNCIINRTKMPCFQYTTIRGILEARGQYANFMTNGVNLVNRKDTPEELAAIERSWYIALRVLSGEKAVNSNGIICPDNMVWASRDIQGKIWWHAPSGTYFCLR